MTLFTHTYTPWFHFSGSPGQIHCHWLFESQVQPLCFLASECRTELSILLWVDALHRWRSWALDTSWGGLCPGKHDSSIGIQKRGVLCSPSCFYPWRKKGGTLWHPPLPTSTLSFPCSQKPSCCLEALMQRKSQHRHPDANPAGVSSGRKHLGS